MLQFIQFEINQIFLNSGIKKDVLIQLLHQVNEIVVINGLVGKKESWRKDTQGKIYTKKNHKHTFEELDPIW